MLKLGAAVIAGLVAMGGWAVVTVKELPEYFVAGQQYTIEFQVRQHGRTLLNDLHPSLVMSSSERRLGGLMGGKDETTIPAIAKSAAGTYGVTFTAPAAGRLFLTIKSGFMSTQLRLYPQLVLAAGQSKPELSRSERGQMLFVAKGCNTCHVNTDLIAGPDNLALAVGPALGGRGRHLAREYVIQKVKNPNSQLMPDLGLTDVEAAAIAAFLSGDRVTASGGR